MATSDWYARWAADHCTAFGFNSDKAHTVLAWGAVFVELFTEAELRAATARLLASEEPLAFVGDHRGAIIRAVKNLRDNAGRKATTSSLVAGCIECGGNGIVVVPHPGMTDEYPPRMKPVLAMPRADPTGLTRTMGVCCVLCEVGIRTRAKTEEQGRPLATISEYEHKYPNWRAVQAERLRVMNAGRTPPTAAEMKELEQLLKAAKEAAAKRERTPQPAR